MNSTIFRFGVSDFVSTEPFLNAERIIASGMDFIEPGLGKVAAMPGEAFRDRAAAIRSAGITVQSMNWFLPESIQVTGPAVDEGANREFLHLALGRAEHLGAKAIVFGSPGSRSVPDGFSAAEARQQMIQFCHQCAAEIRESGHGMRIAVEHVNHTETNFINTFAEALDLVREIDRPEIGLAADFYHFAMEDEATDIMLEAGDLICAVQLADPQDRCFPSPDREVPGLRIFLDQLAQIGYRGGVSVEANLRSEIESDCRRAVEVLRGLCP